MFTLLSCVTIDLSYDDTGHEQEMSNLVIRVLLHRRLPTSASLVTGQPAELCLYRPLFWIHPMWILGKTEPQLRLCRCLVHFGGVTHRMPGTGASGPLPRCG